VITGGDSMLQPVEKHSGVPAYVQIIHMIKKEILMGYLTESSRLPPVRELATIFEVNINTVLKSLDKMAQEEIVQSEQGIGYFIRKTQDVNDEAMPVLRETIRRLKTYGIGLEMTKLLIEELWRTENG